MDKINLLTEGMHSDNEPALQPENTYRDALNGILITYGSNRYAFESIKGNTASFSIPAHYNQKPYQVIGWCSFVDTLIVLSANDESTSVKPGEIGKVTFGNNGIGTYTPLYYHVSFNFSKEYAISHDGIVGKSENSNIKRVVWTDNNNPLMSMNWANSKFTTYISSGSIQVGKQYMVLTTNDTSYITYNGTDYAPGRAAGNIFTGVTAVTTFTTTGSGALVIEYVPIETFNVVPDFSPGSIDYISWGPGNLLCGSYQYLYQLETVDGARTNWSYLSLPVQVVSLEQPSDIMNGYAKQFGLSAVTNSLKSLNLKIDSVDNSTYAKIRVAYRKATAEGVYSNFYVFIYQSLTSSTFSFTHFGNESVFETLNLNTVTTPVVSMDQVKSITTTKNILFAANVGLSNDPSFDLSGCTIKSIEYLLPSDTGNGTNLVINSGSYPISSGYCLFGHNRLKPVDDTVGNDKILPYQWYEVVGTAGGGANKVTYNAVDYSAGQFFRGIPTVKAVTKVGDCVPVAVIRIQKYTSSTTLGSGNYKNIRVGNDYGDFTGIAVSHYLKSYWRREKYRYGIVVYGRKGQRNYVKWIKDYTIPQQWKTSTDTDENGTTIGFNMRLSELSTGGAWENSALRSIGVSFSGLDFNKIATAYGVSLSALNTVVKGFSIVRVERDAQITCQGILYANMKDGTDTYVMALDKIQADKRYDAVDTNLGRRTNSYMFYSPDCLSSYSLNGVTLPNIASGDYIELTDQYDAYDSSDDGIWTNDDLNHYNKFYSQHTGSVGSGLYSKSSVALIDINGTLNVEHNALAVSVGTLPGSFNNQADTDAAIFGGTEKTAWGCDGVHIYTLPSEASYPYGIGKFDAGDNFRSIVNWIRPKSNLYGGTDDSVKANNQYIFCGHYQALDTAFMTYMTGTSDATPSAPGQTKLSGIVNNVEVFGGDCFISNFGFARVSLDRNDTDQFSSGTIIPIESNINENWRGAGSSIFNKDWNYNSPNALNGIDKNQEESWNFYSMYTGNEKSYYFPARPIGFNSNVRDQCIIYRSLPKVDGEIYDNWRVWQQNNFIRVDSKYGEINNIRAKSTRLFYWQNKGFGHVPIYERQMQGTALGDAVQMGVGGIMDRFDELDFNYGNQHQMSLMESPDAFLWFDFRMGKIIRLGFNGEKMIASEVKGKDAYLQRAFDQIESESGTTIFDSDSPLTGKGIVSCYDSVTDIGFMTFKFTRTISTRKYELDFTLGFDNRLSKFVSFFSFIPNHMICHNNFFLMTREVRPTIIANSDYVLGEEITDTGTYKNYVCISSFTSGGPATQPSSDTTHWHQASAVNQIFVNWRSSYCQIFGFARPWYISVVLKSEDLSSIVIDNLEVSGNDTRFSDIFVQNGAGSGSDLNITSTNRNYKYDFGSWWFNLPFIGRTKRLHDHYLLVKMQVKNYTTDITRSSNLVKRIFYVKQFFRKRL